MLHKDMLRQRVDASKDNMVKARYYKSIGDLSTARNWASLEFNKRMNGGYYNSAVRIKREYELPLKMIVDSVNRMYGIWNRSSLKQLRV
ncbi:hypothetical protein ACFL40_06230 [candidate division KSB1 bacterium]